MRKPPWTVLCVLFFVYCSGTETTNPFGKGQGSGVGGDDCEVISSDSIGWTETSDLGKTPQEVFSTVGGSCEAPMNWDGSGWSSLEITPVSGNTTVTVTVQVDEDSVVFLKRGFPENQSGAVPPDVCVSSLEADATVSVKAADGSFDETFDAVVSYRDGEARPTISFEKSDGNLAGEVEIRATDEATEVSIFGEVMPVEEECAGYIGLQTQTTSTNGAEGTDVVGSVGFATWSTSDCEFGQESVDLNEPFKGVNLLDEIANLWEEAVYDAKWEEGAETKLHLTVLASERTACVDMGGDLGETVVIPVQVTVSTDDGLLSEINGNGTVRANVSENGGLQQLQLWMSEELGCESTADELAYSSADCTEVHHVTAQLGINHYLDGKGEDSGRFEFYIHTLAGESENPGSSYADGGVDRLNF